MAKQTSKRPRRAATTPPPTRVENPTWLLSDPVGMGPNPPIATRPETLPFLELRWEDFERLCYRLAQRTGDIEKVWAYGTSGHKQLGIDILVRMRDGSFEAWQTKRHKGFSVTALKTAVNVFLDADWGKQAKKFVLTVACSPNDPSVIDELERTRDALGARGIAFEPLFSRELTERLRLEAVIIDDFFGRAWVEKMCAVEVAAGIAERLSSLDMTTLRRDLRDFYTSWIATVDPGLPLVGQTGAGDIPAPELRRRYVLPDLVVQLGVGEHDRAPVDEEVATEGEEALSAPSDIVQKPQKSLRSRETERRTSVAQFLAATNRAVVAAEAGSGKTTLLRYAALEILAETPELSEVGARYAGYIPLWVPFALWARMSEGKERPPPLEDVVGGFIEALNDSELATRVRRALRARKRIVLLVDGLDETREQPIADALIVSLTMFADRASASILATSRPHGLKALSGIGGTWVRARLAPLSEQQRAALALLWYRILERHELGVDCAQIVVERQASARAERFTKALLGSPGILRLAQTPLFFLSLLKLHRLGRDLPRNRFDASREIIEQLVDHQPKRRAKDAMKLEPAQRMRQRDRLLEDFAFGLQTGELRGTVADGALESEAVARATKVLVSRIGNGDVLQAEEQARTVFSFSEEVAGLLVKKAQNNIGFLHRSLQEYFAGAHLAQLPLDRRVAFIKNNASHTTWKEPLLYLLYLVRNEQEVGHLLEAIEHASVTDVAEEAIRDRLLAEATFADFAHDISKATKLAGRFFAEAELYAPLTRQRTLVAVTVDGLFSQSVSRLCAEKLAEWMPDYHGYGRPYAIRAMLKWNTSLHLACIPVLVRVLGGDLELAWRAAGEVLPVLANGDEEVKRTLLRLARQPKSIETLRAALHALASGWSEDTEVGELAANLRHTHPAGVQVEALRIRVARGEADLGDLESYAAIAFEPGAAHLEMVAPDLMRYFAARHKPELVARLETALERSGRRFDVPLLGALIASDPTNRLIEPSLREVLRERYALSDLFGRSGAPLNLVNWTPQLIRAIEDNLAKEQFYEYDAYWVSKVLPLPSIKGQMVASMKSGRHLSFWSARGLVEGWGKEDAEVRQAFEEMLDAPPKAVAEVAEQLAAVVDARDSVRHAILRALRDKPREVRFLIGGLRRLGMNDDEAFKVSFAAGDPSDQSLRQDQWREAMFRTFPVRPEIRAMALASLNSRDGSVGVIAEVFASDLGLCGRLLQVLAPLPEGARRALVTELGSAASSNDAAFDLVAEARHDTDGAVAGEAVIAWTEACISRNSFGEAERQFLRDELDAIGPEYEHRRAAALAALTITDDAPVFAGLNDQRGDPRDLDIGHLTSYRDGGGRYLKRILPYWDRVTDALGGEAATLKRFGLTTPAALTMLDPGIPNARRLFELLDGTKQTPVRELHERLSAVQRFNPHGALMRSLIEPLLLEAGPVQCRQSNADRWPAVMAAEIFADHFSQSDLRQKVIDVFTSNPLSDCAAGALAETVVRHHEPSLEALLREKTAGLQYTLVTGLRVAAAIGNIVRALEWLLDKDPRETFFWNCSYWVPAFLRRIERDERAGDEMIDAIARAPSPSARLSELALLGLGCKDKAKIRPVLASALRDYLAAPAPTVAFDVTADTYRLASDTVRDLLA
jgi:hypothetical protein